MCGLPEGEARFAPADLDLVMTDALPREQSKPFRFAVSTGTDRPG
jgi:hypothetical protein